jgi:hypothetical protein
MEWLVRDVKQSQSHLRYVKMAEVGLYSMQPTFRHLCVLLANSCGWFFTESSTERIYIFMLMLSMGWTAPTISEY